MKLRSIIIGIFVAISFMASAEESNISFLPNIHGALRSRWEINTQNGDQRFQVRNARLTLDGSIAKPFTYFFQTDLCQAGKMVILDAWGQVAICQGFNVRAGQFRMPFGVETFRAPQNYIFANRTFIGKQVMNYRAVGARLAYTLPSLPLTLEAGVFNPTVIGDHNVWNRTVAYATKAILNFGNGFTGATGYASIRPGDTRANLWDACLVWTRDAWFVQGEYMLKNYCKASLPTAHSWVGIVDWHHPLNNCIFNRWSVQGRYDGMSRHYSLSSTETTEDCARQRITIGATLTYIYKSVHADFRVNYEKYIKYDSSSEKPDCFVAEFVIRF